MIVSKLDLLRRTKALNENRDISIRAVSIETGLSINTIQRLRRPAMERFDAATLETLCRYFGITSLCDLLEYMPDGTTQPDDPEPEE